MYTGCVKFKHQKEKQNSEKKDYRKIYNNFKDKLENLGKDTLDEAKKILDTY
jgi:hypothetical protein